jgi:hypothetical protein
MYKLFGNDISKDVFDAQKHHHKFENNLSGFEAIEKLMKK